MHINRHSATIEHICKICRQANVFFNPCQLLAHARKHSNFSQHVNQDNLNNIVVSALSHEQLKVACANLYDTDLERDLQDLVNNTPIASTSQNDSTPINGSVNKNQVPIQNTGLIIVPNQNGVPSLINPFSNHNFILTENGLVAVPNVQTGISPFQTPTSESNNTNVDANVEVKDKVNGSIKSVLKAPKKVTEIKVAPKQDPVQDTTKKSIVKVKDIGSLLKVSSANSLVKTGPSPTIAWASNGERTCIECNAYVKPSLSLREHYSTLVGLTVPPSCNICHIQLPSKCSLSAHMRLHSEQPPFICPDCVLKFPTFSLLTEHMNKVCFHLDKRVRQKCPVENCKAKVFPNMVAYKRHLLTLHTRSIYKCNLCPIACYTDTSLSAHMKEKHVGCLETPSPYHQCHLCPDRLIPKSRFEQHIEEHIHNSPKMNMYLCKHCNKFNMMRNNHVVHLANCQGAKTNKRTSIDDVSVEAKKMKLDAKVPESVDSEDVSPKVVLTPLNNIVKKTVKTNCFDCKRELSCTFSGDHEQQLPIRCPQCFKASSKPINKLPCPALVKIDPKLAKDKKMHENKNDVEKVKEKKIVELDVEKMMITWNIKSNAKDVDTSDLTLIKLDKNNENQANKTKSMEAVLDNNKTNDETALKQPEAETIIDDDQMVIDESKDIDEASPKKSQKQFVCAVCQWSTEIHDEFKFHVATHRDTDSTYQCMECGLSFKEKANLSEHLTKKHDVEDVDSYIANTTSSVDREAIRAALTSVIVGAAVSPESVEHVCKICKEKFANAADHDKHFRVHGMAFLKQNEMAKAPTDNA